MPDSNKPSNSDDLNFLMNHIDLVDEDIKQWVSKNPNKEKAFFEDNSLNSKKYKEISIKDIKRRQEILHENQNQQVRIQHLKYLFFLAIIWIVFIWGILIIQGFKVFPFPLNPQKYINLEFHLSDTVLIAFMTTTTATVLGLYGIGAYWLFKSNAPKNKHKNEKDKK